MTFSILSMTVKNKEKMDDNMESKSTKASASFFLDKVRGKTYSFVDKLWQRLLKKSYLLLCFLTPVVLISVVFMVLGVFPYGNNSILTLDMNGQYVYFFEQFRDIITGKASLFYTFERSLGGEFLGYYTYYLASPLSIIVGFFPGDMITEAIAFMMIIKTGFSGLTFSIYLDKTKKKNIPAFIMFSTMYALCSYATIFQSNTMWMDALIFLPLIALGIEGIIKEGKFKLFTISLALAIWSNYYIGYMICIFVVLYFFFYIASHPDKEINLLNEKYHFVKSLGRIALFSIVAVMLAGAVVVSAYYSLQFGKVDLQDNSFAPDLRFDILDLVTKLFICSFDTIRGEGTPNIYAGTLMLIMLPVYFISKKIPTREKVGYILLCAIFVLSFSINTIDLIWHGFQMPIWLNYRYSFMFSFILLIMAYKGYEGLSEVSGKTLGVISVSFAVLLAIIQKTVTLTRYIGGEQKQITPDYELIWATLLLLAVYFVLFLIQKKVKAKQIVTLAITLAVCIEAYSSTLYNWTAEIQDAGWASRNVYRSFVNETEIVATTLKLADPTFHRVEKGFSRKPNDNLAIDIKGISEFTSTFNMGARDLLGKLGYNTNSQTTTYVTGNELSESILGIKYVIQNNKKDDDGTLTNKVSNLYDFVEISDDIVIYQNPFALPIAYSVDNMIKQFTLDYDNLTPLEYGEAMLSSMLGKKNQAVHEACKYTISYENCSQVVDEDGRGTSYSRHNSSRSASFTFNVVAQIDGDVQMFLPTLYNTKATCYVNGELFCTLFQSDTYKVLSLGSYKRGDKISVKVTFDAGRIYLLNQGDYFIQLSEDRFKSATDTLKEGGFNVTSYSDTKLVGTIKDTERDTVFTTIPYDACWQVSVDGKRVDTYKCVESMLAFDLPEETDGEYDVVMEYVPMQWYIGIAITTLGLAIFIVLVVLEKKKLWIFAPCKSPKYVDEKPVIITSSPEKPTDNGDKK